jgi:hypothetical protein
MCHPSMFRRDELEKELFAEFNSNDRIEFYAKAIGLTDKQTRTLKALMQDAWFTRAGLHSLCERPYKEAEIEKRTGLACFTMLK